MRRQENRKGSILLLVLGLLTILAMLGSVFLFTARMSSKQNKALSQVPQSDYLAESVVSELKIKLREDLWNSDSGDIYNSENWKFYIDAPGDEFDTYLFQPDKELDPSLTYVDIDSDGTVDSLLKKSGIYNNNGQEYYIASKVIDLSGKLNINTASENDDITVKNKYIIPCNINLKDFVYSENDLCYKDIYLLRTQNSPINIESYYEDCASKLFSPTNGLPFSISEEVFFRGNSNNNIGRISDLLSAYYNQDYSNLLKKNFTVHSVTRPLLRFKNEDEDANNVESKYSKINLYDRSGEFDREKSFKLLNNIISNSELCAAITVNTETMYNQLEAEPYIYNNGDSIVFATVAQPVITDAYMWAQRPIYKIEQTEDEDENLVDGNKTLIFDGGFVYAIEIYNPLYFDIKVSDIFINDNRLVDISSDLIIKSRKKLILFNCGGYFYDRENSKNELNASAFGEYFINNDTANSDPENVFIKNDDLSFYNCTDIKFYLSVIATDKDGNSFNIKKPIDILKASEISSAIDPSNPFDCGTIDGSTEMVTEYRSLERDEKRQAHYVAIYSNKYLNKNFGPENLNGTSEEIYNFLSVDVRQNSLGGTNISNVEQIESIITSFPIFAEIPILNNYNFMSKLYIINPKIISGDNFFLPQQLAEYFLGRLDESYASTIKYIQFPLSLTEPASEKYNSLPAPWFVPEIFEFAKADETRDGCLYGKININTVDNIVLRTIPISNTVLFEKYEYEYEEEGVRALKVSPIELNIDKTKLAEYIVGYRDLINVNKTHTESSSPTRTYSESNRGFEPDEGNLGSPYRTDKYFYATAEIQYPIQHFFKDELIYKLMQDGLDESSAKAIIDSSDFQLVINELTGQVMNILSVNSDTFAVNIRVQVGDDPNPPVGKVWYYLAIIDRSNCFTEKDKPNVLMFTQLK